MRFLGATKQPCARLASPGFESAIMAPPMPATLGSEEPTFSRSGWTTRQRRLVDMSLRVPVALVWLYQGLWSKLLAVSPRQVDVVKSTLRWTSLPPATVLGTIGAIETLLAVWVLSGYRRRLAAIVQTILLATMNAGGLIWGRASIPDPGGMVVNNLAFVALIWCVAGSIGPSNAKP